MISLRGLECLVTIVEQGSLTRAAAVLHISQPALSHQIAAIERELGTAVIERLPRGIRPTAAGLPVIAQGGRAPDAVLRARQPAGTPQTAASERDLAPARVARLPRGKRPTAARRAALGT